MLWAVFCILVYKTQTGCEQLWTLLIVCVNEYMYVA